MEHHHADGGIGRIGSRWQSICYVQGNASPCSNLYRQRHILFSQPHRKTTHLMEKASAFGIQEFLMKPLVTRNLAFTVRRVLNQQPDV
jgi:hypothetical protein